MKLDVGRRNVHVMTADRRLLHKKPFCIGAVICALACVGLLFLEIRTNPWPNDVKWMASLIAFSLGTGLGIVISAAVCTTYEIVRRLYHRDFPVFSSEQKSEIMIVAAVLLLMDSLVPMHVHGVGRHGFFTCAELLAGCQRPTGWVRPFELVLGLGFVGWVIIQIRMAKKENSANKNLERDALNGRRSG